MLAEEHRPVLALLDDHEPRAQLQHAAAGADQVLVARQQPGLAVVEHQAVDPLEHLQHVLAVVDDPVVHRVGHDQFRAGHWSMTRIWISVAPLARKRNLHWR